MKRDEFDDLTAADFDDLLDQHRAAEEVLNARAALTPWLLAMIYRDPDKPAPELTDFMLQSPSKKKDTVSADSGQKAMFAVLKGMAAKNA